MVSYAYHYDYGKTPDYEKNTDCCRVFVRGGSFGG